MRKGQEKILEKACRYGYSDGCIRALSAENLTLKQLEKLMRLLYSCKEKDEQWIEVFSSINDYELMNLIGKYNLRKDTEISVEELKQMSTREKICSYFSRNDVICRNLFDVKVVMTAGFHSYTAALCRFAGEIYNKSEGYVFGIFPMLKSIGECLEHISDYQDFLDGIDTQKLCCGNTRNNIYRIDDIYLSNYTKKYARNHAPFIIGDAKGIPEDIQQMDFHGYSAKIDVKGYARFVSYYPQAVYITCVPYKTVDVWRSGDLKPKTDYKSRSQVTFINKTQEFITGYSTRNGFRYKPAQLKELFFVVSISDNENDRQNAYSVIDFLCRRYDTYIFKDLYKDFLESDGLLLPLTVAETAKYRTKQELFEKHYHMSVSGNWNRRNANLTYLILKLRPRMTDEALARAMQCRNAPKIKKVGKRRYVMTYILYEALYGVPVGNYNAGGLIADALYEEYQNKKIKLLPENQTINEHNARYNAAQADYRVKTVKLKIKKNTRFRKLIDNMPENYELIKTSERLVNEGVMQKNCVAGYAGMINSDYCMIYSVVFENVRHTIEITLKNNCYTVAQCFRACNQTPDRQLLDNLKETVNKINHIQS